MRSSSITWVNNRSGQPRLIPTITHLIIQHYLNNPHPHTHTHSIQLPVIHAVSKPRACSNRPNTTGTYLPLGDPIAENTLFIHTCVAQCKKSISPPPPPPRHVATFFFAPLVNKITRVSCKVSIESARADSTMLGRLAHSWPSRKAGHHAFLVSGDM